MLVEGRVGPAYGQDGVNVQPRLTRFGAICTSDAHGKYFEPCARGLIFTVSTPAAGATVAAGGAVTNPLLAIYNPLGSGKTIGIIDCTAVTLSGTVGAGIVGYYISVQSQAAGAGAANATPVSNGGAIQSSVVKGYAAVTTALAVAPTFLRPMYFSSAIGTVPILQTDFIDGKIVLDPGDCFAINPNATGTTWVLAASITYEEVPTTYP